MVEQKQEQQDNSQPLDQYIYEGELGKGAYGVVWKGRHQDSGETFAIKKTKIDNMNDGIPSTTLREIAILMDLQHENIVSLKDIVMKDTVIFFVQEYCNTDLSKFLQSIPEGQKLTASVIRSYIHQVLMGVAYCHMERIIHRDLKPANILLSG